MNTTATIEKLYDLRLGVMAEAFTTELARTGEASLIFAPAFQDLVGAA